jgi:P4 family phage/plasmid primase-like protien
MNKNPNEKIVSKGAESDQSTRRDNLFRLIIGTPLESFQTVYEGDDLVWVREIATLISLKRTENWESWARLGWCLKNIDDSLENVWVTLSRRSSKYVEGECEQLWTRMRRGTIGVGTLHVWAKADSPEAYRTISSLSVHELVRKSLTGSNHDIACVMFSMFRHSFVCSSIQHNIWYEFTNHHWQPSTTLRKRIPTDVWREFMEASIRLSQMALAAPAHELSDLLDDSKKLSQVAEKCKISLFKDYIMKECAELFYDIKFEDKLDTNIHIIGFENGVYDLEVDEFRDGQPDDFLTFTTRNNYVPYDENSPEAEGIQKYLSQVLPKPEMKDYVLDLFASFLHGLCKEQKFYIWTGTGAKNKLVELFELAFGDYCCKIILNPKRVASNAANSEVAKAKGKRFVCIQEPSGDEKLNIGFMKELSGGDKIIARCIYKEPIEFKPQFKIILLCNTMPDIPSNDGGTWRRIRVVNFECPDPDVEIEFPIDLKEMFMALLIKVYRRYNAAGIHEPKEVLMRATNEYKTQNDHTAEFIDTFIDTRIIRDVNGSIFINDMYMEAYTFSPISIFFPEKYFFEKYIEMTLGVNIVFSSGFKEIRGFRMRNADEEQ